MRKRLEIIALFVVVAALLAAIHLYVTFYTPASREGGVQVVTIPKGMSFRVIAMNLEKAGLIRSSESFIFAASILGAYKKVQAGEYEFDRKMAPIEILDLLVKGKVKKHMITVPEGYGVRDIAALVKEEGLANSDDFVARAMDPQFASALGLEGPTLEGYLYPDTYAFTKGMTVDEMIAKMADTFKAVYRAEFEEAAKKRGLTMRQAITLASIIEKETGSPDERDLISSVFHNRLKKRIKLQSDPTAVYGLVDFNGYITKKHLKAKTPYNTYAIYGLPPGPITNPGKSAIKAALNPAREEYLYFVSKNDGTHYFSKSLEEHNRAVSEYRKSKANSAKTGAEQG